MKKNKLVKSFIGLLILGVLYIHPVLLKAETYPPNIKYITGFINANTNAVVLASSTKRTVLHARLNYNFSSGLYQLSTYAVISCGNGFSLTNTSNNILASLSFTFFSSSSQALNTVSDNTVPQKYLC